jgi:hypothetical protein
MRMRGLHVLLLLTALTVAGVTSATSPAAASDPVRLTFDKHQVAPGVWQGTVSGDITGALTTKLLSRDVTGPIWQVTFDWIVEAASSSFTARLAGTLNTKTGAVVMNGTVTEGHLRGAQVHEEGQLVDPATTEFVGSIQIMPATAA